MMEYKLIFENFSKQYAVNGRFTFHLFPMLFTELLKYGANRSIITEGFISDVLSILLPNESPKVHLRAIECIQHYGAEILPPAPVVKNTIENKQTSEPSANPITQVNTSQKIEVKSTINTATKPETPKNNNLPLPTIQYDDPIPPDDGDDDGTFIPEEERLDLKPEDCAPKKYDWDFIKRIGAVGFEDKK